MKRVNLSLRNRLPPISTPRQYAFVIFILILLLHFILSFSNESYRTGTSLTSIKHLANGESSNHPPMDVALSSSESLAYLNGTQRTANATFVMLCRNSDIEGVASSVQSTEDRFNSRFNYPWVFLNEEPFSEEFKRRISVLTRSQVFFGQIPREYWFQPDWIDEERASTGRRKMTAQRIIYAGSVPYRNMCRFNSGFFFHHELLQQYKYYWRVEPDIKFFCDLTYDPFVYMEENDKIYSFTISLLEWEPTIPTLWATVKEFIAANPQYVSEDNAMEYLSDDGGITYNLCHFWSNFEIASMDFFRSEAYQAFFDYLESKGGFYYERWGDAPVHSIAVALFARRDQIHFFRDIGYRHSPFQHCPSGDMWEEGRCSCNPHDTLDYAPASCVSRFENLFSV